MALSGDALAQSNPYAWQGPYPFGVTEAEIDGIIDHYYLIENPEGDVNQIAVGSRQFIKFQLTGPTFQCWKYSTLCESFGATKAGQFMAEYISILRKKPTGPDSAVMMASLVDEYEQNSQDEVPVTLTATEWLQWETSWQIFLQETPDGDSERITEPGLLGSVELTQGRARYFFGGHNWLRGRAVPLDGADVTADAIFQNQDATGNLRTELARNRTHVNHSVITGPYSNGAFFRTPPRYVTMPGASASSHGATETGSACFRGVPLGTSGDCLGAMP